jgi:hypothetical protein
MRQDQRRALAVEGCFADFQEQVIALPAAIQALHIAYLVYAQIGLKLGGKSIQPILIAAGSLYLNQALQRIQHIRLPLDQPIRHLACIHKIAPIFAFFSLTIQSI